MISPTELTLQDGHRRFANSELYTWKRCRRKWWLTYYRRLHLRYEEPTGPKYVGDRLHRALARWYVPTDVRVSPRDALEELITADRDALRSRLPEETRDDPEMLKKFDADAELERVILAGYAEWLAETGEDAHLDVIASETYAEADLPGVPYVKIIAKLDARARRRDQVIVLLEHKSVGSFDAKTRLLHMDEQVIHQLLVESLRPDSGPAIGGTLYNMLRRVKRTARAKPPFYQRVTVFRSPIELESYQRRLVGTVNDIMTTTELLDHGADPHEVVYPTPNGNCAWDCPFIPVCHMFDDGSRVETALENLYETGDPYSYYTRS